MKRMIVTVMGLLIALLSGIAFTGCGNGKKDALVAQPTQDYSEYTLEGYTAPVWKQTVIGNESVMFVGKNDVAPLLFQPDKVLSVKSADLSVTYTEGTDYILKDGAIALAENTTIPYWQREEYYPAEEKPGQSFEKTGGGWLRYGEGTTFTSKQLAITYEHSGKWSGYTPEDQSGKMQRVLQKLQKKEPVTIVFYGDSIMEGNYSSTGGTQWCRMIGDYLISRFGYVYPDDVTVINASKGGENTLWAINNIDEKVMGYDPDLLIFGFGMNDYGSTPEHYGLQLDTAVSKVVSAGSCDIMLVSPFMPNPEAAEFDKQQKDFEPELVSVAESYNNVGYAKVTSMHRELLKTKRYYDMTFNNINHPNEFMCRIYATTILHSLLGERYTTLDPAAEK